MASRKRTRNQVIADRTEIMALWVKGIPLGQIAQRLELAPAMVSYDVNAVLREWQDSRIFNFNQQMMTELFRIGTIEAEAWRNFELSKQPVTRRKRTKINEQTITIGRPGQPLLQAAQGAANPQAQGPALFNIDETHTGNNHTSQTEGVVNYQGSIKEREGNPRWLQIVLSCVELRCKLLRLLEPEMSAIVADTIKVYAGFDPDKV